jgi:hypothetical protein
MTLTAQVTGGTARGARSRPAEDAACGRTTARFFPSCFTRDLILGGSGTRPTGTGRNLETL